MAPVAVASGAGSCYFDPSWQSGAMETAFAEAIKARDKGEVPVGAALFWDGRLISSAHNERETLNDPLAHAEVTAIRAAARKLGFWRLDRAALVVTLEPCPMCAGAIILARIPVLIYGADDPRAGAAGTLYDLTSDPRLNHSVKVVRGVGRDKSGAMLREFFENRRS